MYQGKVEAPSMPTSVYPGDKHLMPHSFYLRCVDLMHMQPAQRCGDGAQTQPPLVGKSVLATPAFSNSNNNNNKAREGPKRNPYLTCAHTKRSLLSAIPLLPPYKTGCAHCSRPVATPPCLSAPSPSLAAPGAPPSASTSLPANGGGSSTVCAEDCSCCWS